MILAFLQNQWFKNPARMKHQLETTFNGDRPKFISFWLFYSCLTGKRLKKAFGEELCDQIIWEEISPEMGGQSNSSFPPDLMHISAVIEKHKPTIILAFGKLACGAVGTMPTSDMGPTILFGPHPAARHATVTVELRQMKEAVDAIINRIR